MLGVCVAASLPRAAIAQVAVQRTRFELPSSNGHGAILVALDHGDPSRARRILQLREHPYAAEEPQLDARGEEVWNGGGFAAVHTRDLLYDAYFGLRSSAGATWLPSQPADLDASGYLGLEDDSIGGTGIVALEQAWGELHASTLVFAPMDLPHAAMVMVLYVRNDGDVAATGVQAFSLHNLHLGFGRPSSSFAVGTDNGSNGETLVHGEDAGGARFEERGFAGVVVARALGPISHYGTAPGQDPFAIVQSGGDLGDNSPAVGAVDDSSSAWQFDLGTIAPGEQAWVGVVLAHSGDPFAVDEVDGWLDAWIGGRDAEQIVVDEREGWAEFHAGLTLPAGDAYEAALARQSAAMLRMGQVREREVYLREWLDQDGTPRRTR
ncbi:MAG: glycosyl hydrolase, partial [Deltaproteobacteria bacterium]|nr:glycosyl hydrolase [Nannocystaceae bacterium]